MEKYDFQRSVGHEIQLQLLLVPKNRYRNKRDELYRRSSRSNVTDGCDVEVVMGETRDKG
jgi:hypothetical protein